VHVNIWSADPIPEAVAGQLTGLTVSNTVLSGTLADRVALDEVLRLLRRYRVRVVAVEVAP
jgi:hypothetical protein